MLGCRCLIVNRPVLDLAMQLIYKNCLTEQDVHQKILMAPETIQGALLKADLAVPEVPGRSMAIIKANELPPKAGLSETKGLARLVHDLASIELQAMELGIRTLIEFPDAPKEFREQLADITISESYHLSLCLKRLEDLGSHFGEWPVHVALWSSTHASDSLVDRILIVHRYLEGSGLDAGDSILRKLNGLQESSVKDLMKIIVQDEIGHVKFGSDWYRTVCYQEGLDPNQDFFERMNRIRFKVPKRLEVISRRLRQQAGFTEPEIDFLEDFRNQQTKSVGRHRYLMGVDLIKPSQV